MQEVTRIIRDSWISSLSKKMGALTGNVFYDIIRYVKILKGLSVSN